MPYKIVLDSAADAVSWAGASEGIVSVPLKINAGSRHFIDDDQLDVEGMVDYLATFKGKSGTACPGVGEWKRALENDDMTFGITITGRLSGSYNAACLAAQALREEAPERQLRIIDSRMTGPAMRLLAERIQELFAAGRSFADICRETDEYQGRVQLTFALESLRNLANNGRVNPAVAKVAGILGIRVVGRATDGELDPFAKCKGERKTFKTMVAEMVAKGYAGGKVRICHVLNECGAKAVANLIKRDFPAADIWCYPARGLDSFYAERNGMIVGYETE